MVKIGGVDEFESFAGTFFVSFWFLKKLSDGFFLDSSEEMFIHPRSAFGGLEEQLKPSILEYERLEKPSMV